jgi:hypothetical protein
MILPHRIDSIRVVADEASYEYLPLCQRLTDPIEALWEASVATTPSCSSSFVAWNCTVPAFLQKAWPSPAVAASLGGRFGGK